MDQPVILSACRTPIGRLQGTLASLSATDLGAIALREAISRARVTPHLVQEVIMGNVLGAGVGQAPVRQAALKAGLPPTVAALTINKVCGSGLKAVMLAAQAIRAGDADVVAAGGMESMSHAPYLLSRESPKLGDRTLADSMLHDGLTCSFSQRSMGLIAESLATAQCLSRRELDSYASESHRRALAAIENGEFAAEIVPVIVKSRGKEDTIARDEGPRAESTLEKLSSLPPAFTEGGCVTAGNASMISDGAAAVIVASPSFARDHALAPLARIVSYATSGTPPADLFVAPVAAVEVALHRAGLTVADIDLFEINEAFAVQTLACQQRLKIDGSRLNIRGGAIALGHPIGASGARVLVTLLHALRDRGERLGVAALCLGGGNAVAMVVEAMSE
jgi:acetyl-CoA C-acetyltransferase